MSSSEALRLFLNPEALIFPSHSLRNCWLRLGLLTFVLFPLASAMGQPPAADSTTEQIIELLRTRGILTAEDAARIRQTVPRDHENRTLAAILLGKSLISQSDYDRLVGNHDTSTVVPAASAANSFPSVVRAGTPGIQPLVHLSTQRTAMTIRTVPAVLRVNSPQVPPHPTEPGAPSAVERAPSRTVNQALVPIRAFPVGGAGRGEVQAAFKAEGVAFAPYGFIKVTAIQDSSSPNGDDFPLPGFLTDTGPQGAPEFHVKARSTRFGSNFEWSDASSKWILTAKLEADFEGNFNRSDNRNLSSARSSNPSLRLAWGRMDYHFDRNNTFSALFGQDWTTFGSSTLPNILETTGLGIGFGSLYERDPQMRVGFTHTAGRFSILPEFAIDLPSSGLPPSTANIGSQLGYGERQGPDSDRPQLEARLVGQWQLDPAPGVAPAQIIFSGFDGRRTAVVLASAIPAAYQSTFSRGVSAGSAQMGWDAEWQLPTRWFTLIGKYYSGSDLRWYFAGQLYSFFSDTAGLSSTVAVLSQDGASSIVLGTSSNGNQVVAPQRPVRAQGGFAQLGLPLSRIFNANPAGRNAGWSVYGLFGVDQAKARDLNHFGGSRHSSSMIVGTLNYRFNRWISFSYEQSLYTSHANPEQPLPLFRGVRSREWNDIRAEAGPIFYF